MRALHSQTVLLCLQAYANSLDGNVCCHGVWYVRLKGHETVEHFSKHACLNRCHLLFLLLITGHCCHVLAVELVVGMSLTWYCLDGLHDYLSSHMGTITVSTPFITIDSPYDGVQGVCAGKCSQL